MLFGTGFAKEPLRGSWRTHKQRVMTEKKEEKRHKAEDESSSNWHTMEAEAVLDQLETSEDGLSEKEAKERLSSTGPNALPSAGKRGPVKRFIVQFHNILIYVLIVAAAVTIVLGHWLDAGVILGVVVINAIIGFIQEGKAEKALESLKEMLSPTAKVIRDGNEDEIPAEELVPGDIVSFQAGDKIAADVRLVEAKNLKVEESVLTGESEAVAKSLEPVEEKAVLGDRDCMGFSSTLVSYGQGKGVVVATGSETEVGKINRMLSEVEELKTPLLRQIAQFSRWLAIVILGLSFLAFVVMFFVRGDDPAELFLTVVALAVASIPEGLPAILTIALAIGVRRMADRHAIIRKLPAVETLGSVTTIFSDKTGTLTRNEMTVKKVTTTGGAYEVQGSGYKPEGAIEKEGETVDPEEDPILRSLLQAAALCNDAEISKDEDGTWTLKGDPTEGALVTLAAKAGFKPEELEKDFPRKNEIPFESERRFMATLHESEEQSVAFVKGGPEKVLSLCAKQAKGDAEEALDEDFWKEKAGELAKEGNRVLALAAKKDIDVSGEFKENDLKENLVLLGLVGIYDPPREEATKAVKECREAGILVKMVTGDHTLTARAIGRELGLIEEDGEVCKGSELEDESDEELARMVPKTGIFARVDPEHKMRLVEAMQNNGHIVAMTGDGVNDAPALKRADVGVAMGIKGTDVSRDASEMVLTDDNFASIASAVAEGRTVYDNLRKAIIFLLPTNGGQASIIMTALFFGLTRPLTPVQALWINMVTAVTLALSLAFEPPEDQVMRRKPRDPKEPILTRFFVWRIALVSLLLLFSALGLFFWELNIREKEIEIARTAAVNMVFFGQAFYLFNTRFITGSSLKISVLTGNAYTWVAVTALVALQLAYTYLPIMQNLFSSGPITPDTWGIILTASFLIFLLIEAEKWIVRRWVSNL